MGGLNVLAFLGVTLFLPEIARREKGAGLKSTYKQIISSNVSRGLFSFQVGDAAHRGTVQTFIPVFGGLTIGLSSSLIGTILSVLVFGAGVVQIFSGRLADRFNKRVVVIIGSLGILMSMLVVPQAVGFWSLILLLAIAIVGDATALPSASALVIEEGRKYGMGVSMAMFNMGMGVGMSVGPILAGLAADLLGIKAAFYFTGILMFFCIVAFSGFTRHRSGVAT
jgi:MFS family permease